jgi:GNAT superfamily N-acetyltransferase
MKYQIRPVVADDAAKLVGLIGELGYPVTKDFILEKLNQLLSTPGTKILVADQEGEVVGLLCFSILPLLHVNGGLGRISALVIDSRIRGHGIGRRLVAEAEEFAWKNDCARIEITSAEQRGDAHAFYEAVGYRQDSRRFMKHRPA